MTVFVTHSGLQQEQFLIPAHSRASMMAGFALAEHAPWVYSALSDLWDLEHKGQNILGFGDFRVPASTGVRVRRLLSRIGDIANLPVPIVNVFSGGGVTLTWNLGSREVKYTFWPEGVLTYCKEYAGETIEGDELPTDDAFDPRGPVHWLIRG